jgi:hypothetical protein
MSDESYPLEKFPWGCQDKEYKKQMSLLKTEKVDGGDKIYFTYEKVLPSRIPSQDDLSKLWTSVPFDRNKNTLLALTEEELQNFPGLKQHIPHDDDSKIDQDYKDSENAENSYHRMSINRNISTKTGNGPKFLVDGCNACVNAIVTRFDKHGNLQIMAMQRPENAVSDAGEYQLSAGCLFFGGDGHKIIVDDEEYVVKGSVKYNLTEGTENVDNDGKLKGTAKAHAIAAILEKLWTHDTSKDIIDKFDFHLLSNGIVDDVSNTRHRWVETIFVIHHITGSEDLEVLEHLKDSKVNPKRVNVGDGMWKSIDVNPKGKVYSQVGIRQNEKCKKVWVEHDESSRVYNPATEFEFWHGDHSVVAARICEYVSSKYSYVKKGAHGFGVSEEQSKSCNFKHKSKITLKRPRESDLYDKDF